MPVSLPSQAPITSNFNENLENEKANMKVFAFENHANKYTKVKMF